MAIEILRTTENRATTAYHFVKGDDFLGEGVYGSVYTCRDQNNPNAFWVMKIAKDIAYGTRFTEEYETLEDLAQSVQPDGHPVTPTPIFLGSVDGGLLTIIMPFFAPQSTFSAHMRDLWRSNNNFEAEKVLIKAVRDYIAILNHLSKKNVICVDRKLDDFRWVNNQLIVLDWNVLDPRTDDNAKAQLITIGRILYAMMTERNAMTFVPDPFNDTQWTLLSNPNDTQGNGTLALRLLVKEAIEASGDWNTWQTQLEALAGGNLPSFPVLNSVERTLLEADLAWRKAPHDSSSLETRKEAFRQWVRYPKALFKQGTSIPDLVKTYVDGRADLDLSAFDEESAEGWLAKERWQALETLAFPLAQRPQLRKEAASIVLRLQQSVEKDAIFETLPTSEQEALGFQSFSSATATLEKIKDTRGVEDEKAVLTTLIEEVKVRLALLEAHQARTSGNTTVERQALQRALQSNLVDAYQRVLFNRDELEKRLESLGKSTEDLYHVALQQAREAFSTALQASTPEAFLPFLTTLDQLKRNIPAEHREAFLFATRHYRDVFPIMRLAEMGDYTDIPTLLHKLNTLGDAVDEAQKQQWRDKLVQPVLEKMNLLSRVGTRDSLTELKQLFSVFYEGKELRPQLAGYATKLSPIVERFNKQREALKALEATQNEQEKVQLAIDAGLNLQDLGLDRPIQAISQSMGQLEQVTSALSAQEATIKTLESKLSAQEATIKRLETENSPQQPLNTELAQPLPASLITPEEQPRPKSAPSSVLARVLLGIIVLVLALGTGFLGGMLGSGNNPLAPAPTATPSPTVTPTATTTTETPTATATMTPIPYGLSAPSTLTVAIGSVVEIPVELQENGVLSRESTHLLVEVQNGTATNRAPFLEGKAIIQYQASVDAGTQARLTLSLDGRPDVTHIITVNLVNPVVSLVYAGQPVASGGTLETLANPLLKLKATLNDGTPLNNYPLAYRLSQEGQSPVEQSTKTLITGETADLALSMTQGTYSLEIFTPGRFVATFTVTIQTPLTTGALSALTNPDWATLSGGIFKTPPPTPPPTATEYKPLEVAGLPPNHPLKVRYEVLYTASELTQNSVLTLNDEAKLPAIDYDFSSDDTGKFSLAVGVAESGGIVRLTVRDAYGAEQKQFVFPVGISAFSFTANTDINKATWRAERTLALEGNDGVIFGFSPGINSGNERSDANYVGFLLAEGSNKVLLPFWVRQEHLAGVSPEMTTSVSFPAESVKKGNITSAEDSLIYYSIGIRDIFYSDTNPVALLGFTPLTDVPTDPLAVSNVFVTTINKKPKETEVVDVQLVFAIGSKP